ncbi:flagellar basal-body rod protein FlgF [Ramlibacter solisilvae]|uniref:Flagellar hook-basal body protein n=1 Tax=Ramlibacter tataouinensis TaxID=94132 RepID=A0A127JQN2_9BURK|nr:flagellar hook basal-body protein [Ramlibacter tataouinensis]AMO22203.1 flagellar hook-basal body protein [Ramlibacter tataouinensis]
MNEVLAIGLQSMQGDMARLDQVATNLANVLTPGYKRSVALQAPLGASFAAHLTNAAEVAETHAAAAPMQHPSDQRAGTLKATGQPLDVALMGNGYFEVMTDTGLAYTRQGNFRLDARGRLVTAQGHAVMGTSGEIQLNIANPVIATNGTVSAANAAAGTQPLAQLKVVEFDTASAMDRLGDGLHAAGSGMKPLSDEEVQLRQGYLENSNASSTQEMASLIRAMRHFEGMQKMVLGYDEMLGIAIRKLGETS